MAVGCSPAPMRASEPEDLDLGPIWGRVAVPTLLIRGAESDLLLPETARQMAMRPGTRLAEIPGCGHAPALMDAAQIALVAEFVAG